MSWQRQFACLIGFEIQSSNFSKVKVGIAASPRLPLRNALPENPEPSSPLLRKLPETGRPAAGLPSAGNGPANQPDYLGGLPTPHSPCASRNSESGPPGPVRLARERLSVVSLPNRQIAPPRPANSPPKLSRFSAAAKLVVVSLLNGTVLFRGESHPAPSPSQRLDFIRGLSMAHRTDSGHPGLHQGTCASIAGTVMAAGGYDILDTGKTKRVCPSSGNFPGPRPYQALCAPRQSPRQDLKGFVPLTSDSKFPTLFVVGTASITRKLSQPPFLVVLPRYFATVTRLAQPWASCAKVGKGEFHPGNRAALAGSA